ncbi:MAG: antibiotic biosynthesis monooxygenase [Phenylobacterium sp.]|nr:MAG: antibiotic biosynthesis monooxygenase [Phenylobacterium sp.]
MGIARQYVLKAAPGRGDELATALRALADRVRAVPGCEGVEILGDLADEHRFVLLERWASMEAHKRSADLLPKDSFAEVMSILGAKPEAANLTPLHSS